LLLSVLFCPSVVNCLLQRPLLLPLHFVPQFFSAFAVLVSAFVHRRLLVAVRVVDGLRRQSPFVKVAFRPSVVAFVVGPSYQRLPLLLP
jgi:hypothetical protein